LIAVKGSLPISPRPYLRLFQNSAHLLTSLLPTFHFSLVNAHTNTHTQDLALEAVSCITTDLPGGRKEIDVKKYAKVEKLPGGQIEDSRVLKARLFSVPR